LRQRSFTLLYTGKRGKLTRNIFNYGCIVLLGFEVWLSLYKLPLNSPIWSTQQISTSPTCSKIITKNIRTRQRNGPVCMQGNKIKISKFNKKTLKLKVVKNVKKFLIMKKRRRTKYTKKFWQIVTFILYLIPWVRQEEIWRNQKTRKAWQFQKSRHLLNWNRGLD
jgi:hypothetical protein